MKKNFIKADLHVHTPASHCYEDSNTEETYWSILETAKRNQVEVIAITDHNTISGYEKMIALRQKALQDYCVLKEYNADVAAFEELERKVDLVNSVTVLLGVEITLNPGVHIIVLASELQKNDIETLLTNIGYDPESRGIDCASGVDVSMDIKSFLVRPELREKIIIAPHVDSDKGIYNDLKGAYRAEIFKSEVINALSCNSISQKEKIRNNLLKQPDYIRRTPIAFINASDAHRAADIGKKFSYFHIQSKDFQQLKKTFETPDQCISDVESPKFQDFIKNYFDSGKAIAIQNLEDLPAAICAVLNNGYGYVLLGVSLDHQLCGVTLNKKDLQQRIDSDLQRFNGSKERREDLFLSLKCEAIGNGKNIFVIKLRSTGSSLWRYEENEVFITGKNNVPQRANIAQIESLIKNRVVSELLYQEKKDNTAMMEIVDKIKTLTCNVSNFIIADKINTNVSSFLSLFSMEYLPPSTQLASFKRDSHGLNQGKFYIPSDSSYRLPDSYLRYLCPSFKLDEDATNFKNLKKYSSDAIIMTLKGGIHLINNSEWNILPEGNVLVFTPKKNLVEKNISLYSVTAWLKSTLFIWDCLYKMDSSNYISPDVVSKIRIPSGILMEPKGELEQLALQILELESDFLERAASISDYKELEALGNLHNQEILNFVCQIDALFFSYFNITEEEKCHIAEKLKASKIFLYSPLARNEITASQ